MAETQTSIQTLGPAKVMVTFTVEHDEDHTGSKVVDIYLDTFSVNGEEVNCNDFVPAYVLPEWEEAIRKELESDKQDRLDDARIDDYEAGRVA